ncbi:MAG TPA: serine/threonine-protein kinase, partial [Nannocystaceae bacterium]|nr:serine/threonine-protein kinase [Nannocystaceae bacterium]
MSRGGDTPRRVAIVSGEAPTLAPSGAEAETMLPDGRGPPTPAQRLARGSTLGRYVVLDPIGKGGMGVVVSAYDPELDRRVAIKLLRWSEPGSANASRGSARLLREAQALAKVAHVNVVAVHDVGTVAVGEGESSVFVAMELLDGEPMSVWLDRERPPWRTVLDVFVAAGRGLAASHAAGVIHRDFKPENVRLTASGRVVVLDYGLARSSRDSETERSDPRQPTTDGERSGPAIDPRLTLSGTVMGTPAFMSPEQASGHELDAATDQFSFCASLYLGLYGELPFGPEAGLVARAAWDGELRTPIGSAKVPGWLRAVLVRGLARDPAARFPTMDALLDALQNDPSRRRKTIARVAGLVAALGLCWWGASFIAVRNDPCERAAARIDETWTSARHDRVERALVDGSADTE